jgi:hypothetical protein
VTLMDTYRRRPYHPHMSELHPTAIRNDNGTCSYRGCDELATVRRITRRGWFLIQYCVIHEHAAAEHFGPERFEAVS